MDERRPRNADRLHALADELRRVPARKCGMDAREAIATTLLANALRAGAFGDPKFEGFRASVKAYAHWVTAVGYLKRNAERLGLPAATWADGWATEIFHGCKYVAEAIESGGGDPPVIANAGLVGVADFPTRYPWTSDKQRQALKARLHRWRRSKKTDNESRCKRGEDRGEGRETWLYPAEVADQFAKEIRTSKRT
jgi:hypothetical protein